MRLMPESWERNPLLKVLGYVLIVLSGPLGCLLAVVVGPKQKKLPLIPMRDKRELGEV